jgi:hypothetical protein
MIIAGKNRELSLNTTANQEFLTTNNANHTNKTKSKTPTEWVNQRLLPFMDLCVLCVLFVVKFFCFSRFGLVASSEKSPKMGGY